MVDIQPEDTNITDPRDTVETIYFDGFDTERSSSESFDMINYICSRYTAKCEYPIITLRFVYNHREPFLKPFQGS